MATIKQYNVKIDSLKSTKKITSTMKMVSTSKLRKAKLEQANAKDYANHLTGLISRISTTVDSSLHPLLQQSEQVKKVLILVFTSDKGLCASFNTNVNKSVQLWIEEHQSDFQIDLSFCGKRGHKFFKNYAHVNKNYLNMTEKPSFANATKVANEIKEEFICNKYDEVYVAYNEFHSPLSQTTRFKKLLPIEPLELKNNDSVKVAETEYIFEPEKNQTLNFLIPHYFYFSIYFYLLENSAGEHGARMTAMDNATANASELIDQNTLLRNRARQAAITTELIEIVAGAEALK